MGIRSFLGSSFFTMCLSTYFLNWLISFLLHNCMKFCNYLPYIVQWLKHRRDLKFVRNSATKVHHKLGELSSFYWELGRILETWRIWGRNLSGTKGSDLRVVIKINTRLWWIILLWWNLLIIRMRRVRILLIVWVRGVRTCYFFTKNFNAQPMCHFSGMRGIGRYYLILLTKY
jgi:hypothetical protein